MKAAVFLNSKSRLGASGVLEEKLKKALFRVDLEFKKPRTRVQLHAQVLEEVKLGTPFLVACGGDGTLNTLIRPMMDLAKKDPHVELPTLVIIPGGTANDLASEMKISSRIEKAARAIFSSTHRRIDVLEVLSGGTYRYMLTNGGIGIPAKTAQSANQVRHWLSSHTKEGAGLSFLKPIFETTQKVTKMAGSKIYDLLAIPSLVSWNSEDWEIEVTLKNGVQFTTQAPIVLVNNQPTLAKSFLIAPETRNDDGHFNIFILPPKELLPRLRQVLQIRLGNLEEAEEAISFESSGVRLRSLSKKRPMTFFGDGEILFKKAEEIEIQCLAQVLSVATLDDSQ